MRTWHERNVVAVAQRILVGAREIVDESSTYLAERRRTMIFAVRDRLRAEQRHLASTRGRLMMQSRHLLNTTSHHLASTRQLLAAYDPGRRLAQGWSIATTEDGRTVTSVHDVAIGQRLDVRVRDGSIATTVNEKNGASS